MKRREQLFGTNSARLGSNGFVRFQLEAERCAHFLIPGDDCGAAVLEYAYSQRDRNRMREASVIEARVGRAAWTLRVEHVLSPEVLAESQRVLDRYWVTSG